MTVVALYIPARKTYTQPEAKSVATEQTRLMQWTKFIGWTIDETLPNPERQRPPIEKPVSGASASILPRNVRLRLGSAFEYFSTNL